MRNDTKSTLTISMNHLDNNNLMRKFMRELKIRAGYGGDLNVTIECDSGCPEIFFLGHDVLFNLEEDIEDKQ